jgi:hypothetical protein
MSKHNHTSRTAANPYATAYTRTGKLNMHNSKPYRTASQRAAASSAARLVDGRYVSNAPVSYHSAKQKRAAG